MITNSPTSPLRFTTNSLPTLKNWRQKGIGLLRIAFGLVWLVAAWLKWQPAFQNNFVAQVSGAKDGQPGLIQAWISFWTSLISANPLLFARIEAATETAIAIFLLFGLFSNLTSIVGLLLSLGIWSTAEGFGGPYMPGHSTDVGTALPYAILFAVLFSISSGRYYGLDQWLTPRLGRWSFLASGSIKKRSIDRS
jgi:nitrite reductase (NO-forming)